MKRSRQHANHDRWLVSYADFITLLFAFFVVLYASAEVDRHRMNQLAVAIQAGFQNMGVFTNTPKQPLILAPRAADISSSAASELTEPELRNIKRENEEKGLLRARLESELQKQQIPSNYVSVREGADGVIVSLREVGFFDSGSARIRTESAPIFKQLVTLIAEQHRPLRVEGHTDDVPIHNPLFNSNWELSTARATEVIRLLVTQYGFDPEDLSAAGYAEFHPIASNDTSECRSANRRVDIVVLTRTRNLLPLASH
jgi:chemotaxis protein MotB